MIVGLQALDGTPIVCLTPASEKRVQLSCDLCGKESTTAYHNYSLRQAKRDHDGITHCRPCSCRLTAKTRKKTPPANKGKRLPFNQRGKHHPSWRGGTFVDAHGYRMVHIGGDKQPIGWTSYRKEHMVLMEESIGRKLTLQELIHHIDGDKLHNKLHNLFLTDRAGHHKAHWSLQDIGYELYKAGYITFDKAAGRYEAHVKLRELLEQPVEANQQPSQDSNALEGSTTRCETNAVNNPPTSAGHKGTPCDEIV